jgi:hypothetical protein
MPRLTRRELLAASPAAVGVAAVLVGAAAARADQPAMEAALISLTSARKQLEAAEADKGGHRVKALGYVKSAIAEVEKGIEYARKH